MAKASKFADLLSAARGAEAAPDPAEEQPAKPVRQARTPKPAKPAPAAATPKLRKVSAEDTEASKQGDQGTRGRPKTGKRSNQNYTQLTVYLKKDTHRRAKIALLQSGDSQDFSDIVESLVAQWLEKQR